jgi:serine/threonine-protein kinase
MLAITTLEDRFEQVLAEFLQAEERGERPDPSELLRANPDLETSLRDYLRDRDRFNRLAPTARFRTALRAEPLPVNHFGSYRALEQLGEGGRGIVYRVNDPELNRPLAVKVLRPELREEPDAARRFLEEAQVMGQLQHPGIVPVHAVGQLADGRPYFAMKLVEGRTLAQLLALRPAPAHELPRFLVLFQQVCQAVAYAHSRGVIHRDLKPANIMVGAFAEVQVMDWGLAKVLASRERQRPEWASRERAEAPTIRTVRTEAVGQSSEDGLVVGTFAYMAPEQARGRIDELDCRADVFGLGAILHEVLTGEPLYTGAAAWELRLKAAAGDLSEAFARLDRCGADAGLVALARDCLAPARERRPRDAGVVAERLEGYLAEVQERLRRAEVQKAAAEARAAEARATVRAERRARRLTVGLAVAMLAVVVSLTVLGFWLHRQQAEEARQAEALRREVGALLTQAVRLRKGAHFLDSRELLEQARQRLGHEGPADLCEQVARALADTELTRRLDAARQRALTLVGGRPDYAVADREYIAAFKEARLGQEGEKPEAVAAQVRASAVRTELIAALEDWASVARDEPRRAWLLEVARGADPNPERDRLRQPELWRDGAVLARVASETRGAELSPQLVVALTRVLFRSGHDPLPLLRRAQARHPDDYWLNCGLAVVLHQSRQLDEAIGYYRAALALRRDPAEYASLGLTLYDRGTLDEAIATCTEALRIAPNYVPAHVNLGIALCGKDRVDEGMRHFEEALRLDPEAARAHFNLGVALDSQGRLDEAIHHYKEALRLEPNSADTHINLGNVLQTKAMREVASGHTHTRLGNVLETKGLLEEAIGEYHNALAINPQFATAYTNLGAALMKKGQMEEAISHFYTALFLDPRDALALNNLGKVLFERGGVNEAVTRFEEALRIEPRNALFHYNLGLALKTRGHLDAAIDQYRTAIEINPKYTSAHINLGNALCAKNQLAEAIEHYNAAIQIEPTNAGAYGALGAALLIGGRFAAAREATQRSLDRMPAGHPMRRTALQQLRECEEALRKQKREGK